MYLCRKSLRSYANRLFLEENNNLMIDLTSTSRKLLPFTPLLHSTESLMAKGPRPATADSTLSPQGTCLANRYNHFFVD